MAQQVKAPFQAVAIRLVADTRTDEFLNIGVVLLCRPQRFAGARFPASWSRITHAFPTVDLVHLRRLKRLFERGCEAWVADAQQPTLFRGVEDIQSLLATVVKTDDATIQFSPPISGITASAEATLADLFRLYVGKYDEQSEVESRNEAMVWQTVVRLATPDVVRALTRHTLRSSHYEQDFEHAWRNGAWNVAQPLSFDMLDPRGIRDKALLWGSRLHELRPSENDTTVHFVVGMPDERRTREVRRAADDAYEMLAGTTAVENAKVVLEANAGELVRKIEEDLKHAVE
jgi:hypothetical protein